MPVSDTSATVISANGHQLTNLAWVIGRLLRDFEHRANFQIDGGPHPRKASRTVLPFAHSKAAVEKVSTELRLPKSGREAPSRESLRITVFEVDPTQVPGRPTRDWVFKLGMVAILVQIGIAVVPWTLSGNYLPFIVTLGGTGLSLLTSALPQWRNEKYSHYKTGGWTVSITRGNGNRHVMLILGKDHGCHGGLDLEIMAAKSDRAIAPPLTRVCMTILAALSVVLLITVAGLKEDRWCT